MVDERNIRKHCIWSFWSASLSLFVPAVLQALWLSHPSENYRSFLSFEGAEIISETICWLFRISRNWTHPPSQPLVYVTDTDCTTTGGSNVVLIDQFKSQTFAFDCWHQWGQTHSCTFHNPGLRLHYAVKSPSRAEIWCAGPRHPPSQEQRSNWSDPVQHVRLGAAEAIHKAQIQSIFILQVTCMYVC